MGFASKLFKCGKIDGAVLGKWQGNLGHLQLNLHFLEKEKRQQKGENSISYSKNTIFSCSFKYSGKTKELIVRMPVLSKYLLIFVSTALAQLDTLLYTVKTCPQIVNLSYGHRNQKKRTIGGVVAQWSSAYSSRNRSKPKREFVRASNRSRVGTNQDRHLPSARSSMRVHGEAFVIETLANSINVASRAFDEETSIHTLQIKSPPGEEQILWNKLKIFS